MFTLIFRLWLSPSTLEGQINVNSEDRRKGGRHHIYQSPFTGCRVKCHGDYFNGAPIAVPGVSIFHISIYPVG